ncbi:uncharacterized protein LOC128193882 [Vigna angularis]|uniref:uncharacterized protein LOC128193882 n=1 Tax=Phaseolus angularis TaxID=3914 RepID=UPI0022B301C6|nr:uncharacterized protein LOC128193882 [Vigna angularis]
MTEALQQIPEYAEFLKKLLKRKEYLKEETMEIQEECSVILQKELPPKVEDPGSFTIPCTIGNHKIGKAIGGLEVKPARMTLFMADGSTKKPYGMVEDVMVQIENLIPGRFCDNRDGG